ncbi:hypothetical protein [Bacillus tuaregi]|uniref:hypothetical protein n=1 Tax=Bacillus tuaregi TaxID=1816695 RepID=UPI001F27AC15|nr:hypothetical protein [Bacillus tuaregi]
MKSLRSDKIYREILQAPEAEKVELFRHQMLAPWNYSKNGRAIPVSFQYYS